MTLPADPARGVTASLWLPSWLVGRAQNLRLYERRGLLDPGRTAGGTRRYSSDDLDRLRRIGELLDSGLTSPESHSSSTSNSTTHGSARNWTTTPPDCIVASGPWATASGPPARWERSGS